MAPVSLITPLLVPETDPQELLEEEPSEYAQIFTNKKLVFLPPPPQPSPPPPLPPAEAKSAPIFLTRSQSLVLGRMSDVYTEGGRPVFVITGRAGVGKSFLIERFCAKFGLTPCIVDPLDMSGVEKIVTTLARVCLSKTFVGKPALVFDGIDTEIHFESEKDTAVVDLPQGCEKIKVKGGPKLPKWPKNFPRLIKTFAQHFLTVLKVPIICTYNEWSSSIMELENNVACCTKYTVYPPNFGEMQQIWPVVTTRPKILLDCCHMSDGDIRQYQYNILFCNSSQRFTLPDGVNFDGTVFQQLNRLLFCKRNPVALPPNHNTLPLFHTNYACAVATRSSSTRSGLWKMELTETVASILSDIDILEWHSDGLNQTIGTELLLEGIRQVRRGMVSENDMFFEKVPFLEKNQHGGNARATCMPVTDYLLTRKQKENVPDQLLTLDL